ncbi:MAG TPA: A24 family peptidase [Bryobacteraceae bacterium]|jgi:prepilin peptidase CpaA|nr:A24 family peptidase [Bryobacteraceae bacterium]
MPFVLKCVLVALVGFAAAYDFRFRRIPNWLNLSGIVLGAGANTLLFARHGLEAALMGFGLALALYLPLYMLRAMGAGDAKLMSAVGSVVGPQNWVVIFLFTAIAGGILAVAVALSKKDLKRTFLNVAVLMNELTHFRAPAVRHESLDVKSQRSMRLPHGVSIAAGSVAFLILNSYLHL